MKRHVVLIGLPGAGKSVVGQAAAERLGCAFRDVDAEISADMGMSISEVFRARGEAAFRKAERAAMAAALAAEPHVIAPGGGWAAQAGALAQAGPRALLVLLRCRPETAATRLEGTRDRPLLEGDRLTRLRSLLAARAAAYEQAEASVETDGRTVAEVADEVVRLARRDGGW